MNKNSAKNASVPDFQVRQFQEIIVKIFQCCQERLQYQSERFGLPDAELRCLMLFESERYLTPKSIALKLSVVKSRVTSIVNKLQKKNLLHKIRDPEDSRVKLLSTTPAGQKKIIAIRKFQEELHHEVLHQIAPEQRIAMLTNLNILMASLESVKEMMI
jgi:DNA-binding MarR family transcriptional regulator